MKRNWLFVVISLFLSLFLSSCEIGLGASVDVQNPTVGITYPELSGIIRGTFILSGVCDDDTGVDSVEVVVNRVGTDGKVTNAGTYQAQIDESGKTWKLELNQYDSENPDYVNGWEYKDGTYEISAVAKDKASRKSQESVRAYDIDNAPPLLILSSPGIDDLLNPTSYGTTLKIKGNISDAHSAAKLTMKIYEYDLTTGEKGNVLAELTETSLEKISDDGIVFAQKGGDENKSARFKKLYDEYDFEDPAIPGNKQYICEFEVSDNAKLYRNGAEETQDGNTTSFFYFNDDVYNAWLTQDVKLGFSEARKILSGTYEGEYVEGLSVQTPKLEDGKIIRGDKNLITHDSVKAASDYVKDNLKVQTATFTLNKDANPKFSVNGMTYNPDEVPTAESDGAVYVKIKAGRDGIFFEPKTLKIYLFGPYGNLNKELMDSIYDNPESYYENHTEEGYYLLEDNSSYSSSSVDLYEYEAILPSDIAGGKYYVIAATGNDKEGNKVDASSNVYYAFMGDQRVASAKIDWWTKEETEAHHNTFVNSVNRDGIINSRNLDLSFSGYVSSLTDIQDIKYEAVITTEEDINTALNTISGSLLDGKVKLQADPADSHKRVWSFNLKNGENYAELENEKEYLVTITLEVENGTSTSVERRFHIDTTKPKVLINSVSPVITEDGSDYLNGKVKISSSVTETNLKNVWYEIYADGSTEPVYKEDLGVSYNINAVIDTTDTAKYKTADKKSVKIVIKAEDKAGLVGEYSTTTFNEGKEFIIDQERDRPVISFTTPATQYLTADGKTRADLTSDDYYAGKTKLIGTVTDDDSLTSVKITVKSEDGSRTVAEYNIPHVAGTTSAINYPMPENDGVYQVTVEATDSTYGEASENYKQYRKTVAGPFLVGIDTSSPELTETHGNGSFTAKDAFTLQGTAKDANGIKEIQIKAVNKQKNESSLWKWSAGEITYDGNSAWSKVLAKNKLDDGTYELEITAEDYAGKTSTEKRTVVVDTVKPVVESSITNSDKVVIGDNCWFGTTQIQLSASVVEETSGIESVQYAVGSEETKVWKPFISEERADGSVYWHAEASCPVQGENLISVKATDVAGNESLISTHTVFIDTTIPGKITLASIDGEEFTGSKLLVNGNLPRFNPDDENYNPLKVVIHIESSSTASSGLKEVKITSIGDSSRSITGAAGPEPRQFIFELGKEDLGTGSVTVKAYDNVGNERELQSLFIMDNDNIAPSIQIKSVTPVVEENGHKYLNGKITVNAVIDEQNLKNVWYEVYSNGDTEPGYSSKDEDNPTAIFTFSAEIHTTEFANGKTFTVKIYAEDQAGNISCVDTTNNLNGGTAFELKQSTDKPAFTASNFQMRTSSSEILTDEWFDNKGNNKLIGSIGDDDGLIAVAVTVTKEDGTPLIPEINNKPLALNANSTTVPFNYVLPSDDGIYKIVFTAKDNTYITGTSAEHTAEEIAEINKNRILETVPFFVGVDTAAPSVEITSHGSGTNTIGLANLTGGKFTLSGTASDNNGIKKVEITASPKTGDAKTWSTSDESTTVNYADGNWSKEFTAGNGKELADGEYTISVTVTDPAGKTSSTERTFVIDTIAPTVSATVSQAGGTVIDENKWYGTSQIAVTATTSDATSGVSSVEYSTDEGEDKNWNSFTKGSTTEGIITWTTSVSCAKQGANKIYVRATDSANNIGSIQNEYLTIRVDTKAPATGEGCTLVSVEGIEGFSGTKLVNAKNPITFVISAKDDETEADGFTGVASVSVIKIGNGAEWTDPIIVNAADTTDGKYTIVIPKEKLTVSGSINVKVTDKAGNFAVFTPFAIDSDIMSPTIAIADVIDEDDSTTDVIDVNQTLVINGTASDTREMAEVSVYYAIAASSPAVPSDEEKGDSSQWNSSWQRTTKTGNESYSWSVSIPTTEADDGKYVYVYAVAKDSADNINYATKGITTPVKVNQDSDRPALHLNNLELTDPENGSYWHTVNQLYGTVEDDDGTVTSVHWSYTGADDSWSENIYSKGMWRITGLEEGSKSIYIKIVDKLGSVFITNAESTSYDTYGPKIYDSREEKCLGFTNANKNTVLNLKIDVGAPTLTKPKAYVSDSAELAANPDWSHSIDDPEAFSVVGGTKKYLFLKLESSDKNGVAGIKAEINGKVSTTNSSSADYEIAKQVSSTDISDGGREIKTVIVRFDLSKVGSDKDAPSTATGQKKLKVTAIDKAGKESEESFDLSIDNTAPVIAYTSRLSSNIYGSIGNTIQGSTTDAHEVKELWCTVTASETELTGAALTATRPADDKFEKIAWPVANENEISIMNWMIFFDGADTTRNEYHSKKLTKWYQTLTQKTDSEMENDDSLKYFYLWTYAVDECGNKSVPQPMKMNVLLNGDKPSLVISYPENNQSVGGTIRVTGTTSIATSSVKKVYVQIDPGYTGSFASNWETKNNNLVRNNYTIQDTGVSAGDYTRGIPADGTVGWSLNVNSLGEFDTLGDSENKVKIAIRAFAVSESGKVSDAVIHIVEIDPDAPLIGDSEKLKLVQYETSAGSGIPCTDGSVSSGNIAAEQEYDLSKGYIDLKGIWYLTGTIEDQSGISFASITTKKSGNLLPTVKELVKYDSTTGRITTDTDSVSVDDDHVPTIENAVCKNYRLNYKIGNTDDEFGSLEYKIEIRDNSTQHLPASVTVRVNFDNKAPELAVTSSSSGIASTAEFKDIYQNNGTYTLAGTYTEKAEGQISQSGFDRIVIYYTRTLNKGTASEVTYLIDPMISSGTTGTANRYEINSTNFVSATVNADDGLYWRTGQGTVANNVLTVSSFKGEDYDSTDNPLAPLVRAGGLVKINNVIYRIKAVSGNAVTVDGSLQNITAAADVYFAAAALVVDNTVTETGTTAAYDPSKSTADGKDHMSNGDGDQMTESVTTSNNANYNWTVSIDSTNILDGDVDVHFVAFDKAGNIVKDDTTLAGAKVANNAPRLAGVKFGTDLNGNGTVEDSELKTDYSNLYANIRQLTSPTGATANGKDGNGNNITELNVAEADRLVVKGAMKVIPQIVGGNIGLGWQYTYKTAAAGNAEKTTAIVNYTGAGAQHSSDGSIRNGENGANDSVYAINISTLDLLQLDSNNGIMAGEQTIKFAVVDKTEGGSLSASVNLPVNVVLSDTVAPTAVFRPFYWNSKDSNSLYNNSRENGHIELEGDLPAAFTTGGSGVMDRDPKVSGIISMDGVAEDNVLVKSIAVNVDGTSYTVAERGENGTWTSGTDNANLLVKDAAHTYADYKFTGEGSQNWYFELVSDEFDLATGENTVTFRFHWNTAKLISTVAKANVAVKVTATDRGSISLDEAKTGLTYAAGKSSTPGTSQTTADTNTGYYKMDVVPYITGLRTAMTKLEKLNPSAYGRSATGRYPVYYYQKNASNKEQKETVGILGFNLTGAKVKFTGTTTTATLNADNEFSVPSAALSGPLTVTVNNVGNLNNQNNDNAKGSYAGAYTDNTYANCYNRQPNGQTNNNLTDDIEIAVWGLNSRAALPSSGNLGEVTMHINPKTGMPGLSFTHGADLASYPMATKSDGTDQSNSYQKWTYGYTSVNTVEFVYDAQGHMFGTNAGTDTATSSKKASRFRITSSIWGLNSDFSKQSDYNSCYGKQNALRLEYQALQSPSFVAKPDRIQNPRMATSIPSNSGTTTNLYLMYYDTLTNELKFRAGSLANTEEFNNGNANNVYTTGDDTKDRTKDGVVFSSAGTKFGDFVDDAYMNNASYKTEYSHCSIVTNSTSDYKASKYYAIAVVPEAVEVTVDETTTKEDVIVAVWYDASNGHLWYSYLENPLAKAGNRASDGALDTSWHTPVKIIDGSAGGYCAIAVDEDKHIHIASYSKEDAGSLLYTYLDTYTGWKSAAENTCTVDSYGTTGWYLTMDIAKDSSGHTIPYIGYYMTSMQYPKYAYLVDTESSGKNGATWAPKAGTDDNNLYTGAWESMLLPTQSTVKMDDINIGVWKYLAAEDGAIKGQIKAIPKGSLSANNTTGSVWGNGSLNPLFAYAIDNVTTSYVETAQLK